MSGGTTQHLGVTGLPKIGVDRGLDFVAGGTNYLLSPSNDNEEKTPRKFVEEGFKNSLAGAASSSGKWAADTSDAAINQAIPNHMQGVDVSRRDVLSGHVPAAPVSGGDAQGYDQRRY
ncbi:hypothetical protein [Rothia nasisuis]|uniref:hypothetical protein n=1 Tax=Rothia nasisuis TaxID=2109647 RepID=UPI001F3E0074|nr:hypothetical protein [Rothia nasisuis]